MIHNMVKAFVRFVGFCLHVQNVLRNLINSGYQQYPYHLNQGMPMLKIVTIKKLLEHYNDWIIVKFLDNKTPQVYFDNIHAFIIT